ncbi:MAG: hypothetical protein AABW88_00005, partial [Nanoarchaeota archaeon]
LERKRGSKSLFKTFIYLKRYKKTMERNLSSRDKKFVQDMLINMEKSHKIEPESKNPDVKEVEQLTDSIRRRLQRGE